MLRFYAFSHMYIRSAKKRKARRNLASFSVFEFLQYALKTQAVDDSQTVRYYPYAIYGIYRPLSGHRSGFHGIVEVKC